MGGEVKEKCCFTCYGGFGASVWKYKCTDCAHSFCSSHCKDLWAEIDDVEVEEGEEDPFTFLKSDPPADPSDLPFPHGDGASTISSVAPSPSSASGSKNGTRLLCIECYAPRRMALLREELYDTLDELEELSANNLQESSDGTWRYVPAAIAAMTPDAVSSGTSVVTSAVGRSVGIGMELLNGTSAAVVGGGSMLYGVARNVTTAPTSAVKKVVTTAASAPSALLYAPSSVFSYFSSPKTSGRADEAKVVEGKPEEGVGGESDVERFYREIAEARSKSESAGASSEVQDGREQVLGEKRVSVDAETAADIEKIEKKEQRERQEIVPLLSAEEQQNLLAQQQQQLQEKLHKQQKCKARSSVLEAEMADLQLRMAAAETLRSKAWLSITMPTESDVWYAGYEVSCAYIYIYIYIYWGRGGLFSYTPFRLGIFLFLLPPLQQTQQHIDAHLSCLMNLQGVLAWQSQGVVRHLTVRIGTYVGSYVSSWQELVRFVLCGVCMCMCAYVC